MNRMQAKLSCLLVLVALPVFASIRHAAPGHDPGMQAWNTVEEIQRAAEKSRTPGYDSHGARWVLAPDGRYAMVLLPDEHHDAPRSAMVGRYRRDGNWLTIHYEGGALDLDGMSKEKRAEFEAWQAESEAEAQAELARFEAGLAEEASDAAIDEAQLEAIEAAVDGENDGGEEDGMQQRYLIVPYRGGELLLDENMLIHIASGWKGEGPLQLMPMAWRLPGPDRISGNDEQTMEFSIDNPLQAGLPWELARLLRRDAIEARVTEVLETSETLSWNRHMAEVHLRLDRGEQHGLYAGMDVYGLPPDEDVFAALTEVHPDYAIAKFEVQRFSPQDQPALPTNGLRVTTRRSGSTGCAIDTSAAVRGKVLNVAVEPEKLVWDADGFAWVELTLDQGSAQGLAVGDQLQGEEYSLDGEGRVRSVSSDRAVVLWRVQRYDEEQAVDLPKAGVALVTPAWRRAEWDVFGARGAE